MKRNNKQLSSLPATIESTPLRMVYKNEEVINETRTIAPEKETTTLKAPARLFVTEPLPLFNDYKFKAKDHDPL
ncbi:hypothetical protein A4H97_20205 [Niastella yeongjuensis]|uniref:Uncharacterized protein n=1 Tax=Niastella yeongjuensis TaxID=354355 RepID=A0A1V9FBZ8_9BACT|nr:hypothetical protein [Niastella yeongjuensis]OQP55915.1 hypothetical protein A4H97_20205 [Niastella yeongjuensis]SEP27068.1 hypothetical protein SAMN05660816_05032 [Niastella yeongjuensis]